MRWRERPPLNPFDIRASVRTDCSDIDPEGAVTLLPRTGPQPAPLPHTQHQAHHIPEPGALALIGAGIASLLIRRTA